MYGIAEVTAQTVQQVTKMILDGKMTKSITTSTGLTGIRLDAPAKQLVPLLSPFRQTIPRNVKDGATASQWKSITAISSPKPTTQESAAGAAFATTVASLSGTYKVMGILGKVTREAVAASQGFDPALAKETANTLLLAMKLEDQYMLGGNITALGTPAAPTVALGTTAGSLNPSATTYYARVLALTLPAANRVTVHQTADKNANNENLFDGNAITVGAFPLTDGLTNIGAEGNSGSQTSTNKSLKVTWTPFPGAAAYAVFVGTASGAGSLRCQGIFTATQVTFTNLKTATSILANDGSIPGSDSTADALAYDGIIAQVTAGGSGAYVKNLNASLGQSGGEILEVQDAFASIYQTTKVGKFRVVVGGQEQRTLTRLGILAGGGPTIQINPADAARSALVQGYHVGYIINSVTGDLCPVETQPWMPGGAILILPMEIPFPSANAEGPFDMAMGYDWERWDYASTESTGPVYPFEVRCYGVLRGLFTGGCGYIYNIWKG